MNSEFVEGKKFLTESFEGDDGKNKGIILHNLACAGWWHIEKFNGIDESYLIEEIKKELQQSVKDYKESIPNFKKSIMIINGLKEEYNIDKNVLEMPNSVLSILNIGEIYLQNAIFEVIFKVASLEMAEKRD